MAPSAEVRRSGLPFRIVVLANVAPASTALASGRMQIDKDSLQHVLHSLHLELALSLPNTLAATPPHVELQLPIASLRDFRPAALMPKILSLTTLMNFRQLIQHVRQGVIRQSDFTQQLDAYRGFTALAEPIRLCFAAFERRHTPPTAPAPTPSAPSAPPQDAEDAVDRILDMVDVSDTSSPERADTPPAVTGAVSSFIAEVAGSDAPGARPTPSALEKALHYTDALVTQELNAVLHHPVLQHVEATWRGLKFLVDQIDFRENIQLDLFNTSQEDAAATLQRHLVQPARDGLETTPVSMILAAFELGNTQTDMTLLQELADAAEFLQAPLLCNVGTSFFGLDVAQDMTQHSLLGPLFEQPEYTKWRAFHDQESARWLAATYNRFLLRPLYEADEVGGDGFVFTEKVEDDSGYLWGNPVWAVGSLIARSVAETGWPTEVTGAQAGRVSDLAIRPHVLRSGAPMSIPLEVYLPPQLTEEFHDFGLIPLSCRPDSDVAYVAQAPTLYRPPKYRLERAGSFVHHSLPYQLLVGRLAAIITHQAGNLVVGKTRPQVETAFHDWLQELVSPIDPGCQVSVTIDSIPNRPAENQLVLTIRLNTRALRGVEVEFCLPYAAG